MRCGKLHWNPQHFRCRIQACPKSMSNLCSFLSFLTVEKVRVLWVFLVQKGPNLFLSISVQKPALEKGNVHVQVFSALFSWVIWAKAAGGERPLSGLCQASQWWLTSFSQALHQEHDSEMLSWRRQYQEWKCSLKQKWSVWNAEQNIFSSFPLDQSSLDSVL